MTGNRNTATGYLALMDNDARVTILRLVIMHFFITLMGLVMWRLVLMHFEIIVVVVIMLRLVMVHLLITVVVIIMWRLVIKHLMQTNSEVKIRRLGLVHLETGTDGSFNVAIGYAALSDNSGNYNTATGYRALQANTDGSCNVATGSNALWSNTTGSYNVATGYDALYINTDGSCNVATGFRALADNSGGSCNVVTGFQTASNNINGDNNVATGYQALYNNTSGGYNVAIGSSALLTNDASYNTAIGYNAGNGPTDISNTINIGYDTVCNASNTACIGNADISCVYFGSTSGLAKLDCSGIITTGDIDMSCNRITDVSGIYFCDGSSFTHGNSLDITASTVHIVNTNLIVDSTIEATGGFVGTISGDQPNITSVGTLTGLTVTNPIAGSVNGSSGSCTGNAHTATTAQDANNLLNPPTWNQNTTGTAALAHSATNAGTVTTGHQPCITSVGTLISLAVTSPIQGSVTGNAGIATTAGSVTGSQASAITTNSAKVGITSSQASAIAANTNKTGITSSQASAITTNTAKTGITSSQASAISANTAKTGITSSQTSAITVNSNKTGITSSQASAISANTAKVGFTDALVAANSAVTANTAKVGFTDALVAANSAVTANTAKVGFTDALVAANSAVTANTAKVGFTDALVAANSAVTANTAKVGFTDALVAANSAVSANTAKITFPGLGNTSTTALAGNGTAATATNAGIVTTPAQTNITSVGTLTALQVDNIKIDDSTISTTSSTAGITLDPLSGTTTLMGNVTVVAPTHNLNPATKLYVDQTATGLKVQSHVQLATDTSMNFPFTGALTVDGSANPIVGIRILIKNQSDASQNGVWNVSSSTWTRSSDFLQGANVSNFYVFVEYGFANIHTGWVVDGPNAIVGSPSGIQFNQFSSTGDITAGAGLTKTGEILTIDACNSSGIYTLPDTSLLGTPASGILTNCSFPTLNQSTTGNAATATALNTTNNGIVKTTSNNGTLSIGPLDSNDIPNNAADTTGNAATATKITSIVTSDIVQKTTLQTLTQKTMDYNSNTFQNFPFITNNNTLTNGAGFITASSTNTLTNKSLSYGQLTGTPPIPTNNNTLTNGAGFITASSTNTLTNKSLSYGQLTGTPPIPTNNNTLTNGAGFITASSTNTLTNKSLSYGQLTGTPPIPTNNNQLINGEGYITNSLNQYTYSNLASIPTDIITETNAKVLSNKTLQTATLINGVINGILTGDINGSSTSCTGNAHTATTAAACAFTGLTGTPPTWNQNTTGTAAFATTAQGAHNLLNVPTWNQNTTGTAATVTTPAQTNITSVGTLTGLTVSGGIGIGAVDDQGLHPFRVDTNGNLTTPSILIPNGSITSENATIDFWCKIGPPNSLQSQYPLEVHGSDGIMSPYYWNVTGGIEIEGKGTGGYKALPYAGQNAVGVSILADAFIWAKGGFMLSSDRRIKENIRDVSDNVSLQQLRDISCCFYEYKDKLSKGWYTTIGFIAQQVKEHLPSAVSLHKSVIPNEMRNIENPQWSNAMDASMNNVYKLTIPDLEDVSGNTKYKFFVTNDPSGGEITKEISSMENDPKSFIFEEQWQNLFLYGKEVNDFHTLDKDNIYAVHFSASQEMDRVQQEEKTKLAFAKAKISVLESENKELKARLTSIEARLDVAGI